jgi:hypothetical protein
MMAAMREMCPRGEEKTNLFACLFLQRLPREIRVLLSRVDHKDPKLLAEEADALWTLHGQSAAIAAVPAVFDLPVTADDSTVAAVRQGNGATLGGGEAAVAAARAAAAVPPALRRPRPPERLAWRRASATNTGGLVRMPISVSSPAIGRETPLPGAIERRRPRPAAACD